MSEKWIDHIRNLVQYDGAVLSSDVVIKILDAFDVTTDALELLANKENWSSGDTELYGHFTAREVAERALKKIRGEEVEP